MVVEAEAAPFSALVVGTTEAELTFQVTTDVDVVLSCESDPPNQGGAEVTCAIATAGTLAAAAGVAQEVRVSVSDVGETGTANVRLTATESSGPPGQRAEGSASTSFEVTEQQDLAGDSLTTESLSSGAQLEITEGQNGDTIPVLPSQTDTVTFDVEMVEGDNFTEVTFTGGCDLGLTGCDADPSSQFMSPSDQVTVEVPFVAGSTPTTAMLQMTAKALDGGGGGDLSMTTDTTMSSTDSTSTTTSLDSTSVQSLESGSSEVTGTVWIEIVGTVTVTELADTTDVFEGDAAQIAFEVSYDSDQTSFSVSPSCSGVSGTCTASSSTADAGGGVTDTIQVSITGGTAGTVGSVTLSATAPLRSDQATSYVNNLTSLTQVAVTPPTGTILVSDGQSGTASFDVQHTSGPSTTLAFDATCGTGLSGCTDPSSQTISQGQTITVDVPFTGTSIGQTTVDLRVSPNGVGGQHEVTSTANVEVVDNVVVTATNSPVDVFEGQTADVEFDISYSGSTTTFDLSATCSGVAAGTCDLSSTTASAGSGSSATVTVTIEGSTAGSSGTVTLTATAPARSDAADATVNTVSLPLLNVTGPSGTQYIPLSGGSIAFDVAYQDGPTSLVTFDASCGSGTVTCSPSPGSKTMSLNDDQTVDVAVRWSSLGSRSAVLTATSDAGGDPDSFNASVEVVGDLTVTALNSPLNLAEGQAEDVHFEVASGGSAAESFSLTHGCGGLQPCTISSSTATAGGGVKDTISISVTGLAPGNDRTVTLTATAPFSSSYEATGSALVKSLDTTTLFTLDESLVTQNPGDDFDRSQCLTVAAGPVTIQCDDVVMAYGLPSVRTLNQPRSFSLIYNSAMASPRPMIGVEVTLDSLPGHQLEGRLTLDGASTPIDVRAWPAAELTTGQPIRLALAPDLSGQSNGLHEITVELHWSDSPGGTQVLAAVMTDTVPIVSWADSGDPVVSTIGAGWSHSANERLYPDQVGGRILLVGAGGSTLVYDQAGTGTWVALRDVLPDTITAVLGSDPWWDPPVEGYERHLVGGGTVEYTADGVMTKATDVFGNATRFVHGGPSGALSEIYFPIKSLGSDALAYTLNHSAGKLTSIDIAGGRSMTVTPGSPGPSKLTDPTGVDLDLTYRADGLIETLTDAFGAVTTISYDQSSAGHPLKVGEVKGTATGEADIVYDYDAFSSLGVDTPTLVSNAYARVDGPRTDVTDVATFWLTGWRAPWKIQDPDGMTTFDRTNATFPRLVTAVHQPNGRTDQQTYDSFGRLATVSIGGAGTTTYAWDDTWHRVATVQHPEGQTQVFTIAANGTLSSEKWQSHTGSQVSYQYHANPALLHKITQGGVTETLDYDPDGNLETVTSPSGNVTTYGTDAAGRVTSVESPEGNGGSRTATTTYDAADRVKTQTADSVTVTNHYDATTGALSSIDRSGAGVPTLTISYDHDGFGRVDRETAPDGASESYSYDPAGNLKTRTTRRGLAISYGYDAMGRLKTETREAPNGPSATSPDTLHERIGVEVHGTTISGETLSYTYDVMGNLETATNDAAEITRDYDLAGRMRSETLEIFGYQGSIDRTFTTRYTHYDDGRRKTMTRPSNLALNTERVVDYTYDVARGYLKTVELGVRSVTWTLDDRDRVSRIDHGPIVESIGYTIEDRRSTRTVTSPFGTFIDESFSHESDGRLSSVNSSTSHSDMEYNAAGMLTDFVQEDALNSPPVWSREEQRQHDAFGNPTSVVKTDSLTAGYAERFLLREPTYGGAAHRLQTYGVRNADSTLVAETIEYDAEGNRTRYTTTAADDYFVDVEMMYDAVGQLRYVDRRICKMTAVDAAAGVGDRGCVGDPDQLGSVQDSVFRDQSVFQEYLYDALGRRVLIYSRASDGQCGTSNCPNYVERVVWDGDQILFEARYPSVDLEATGGGTINADLGRIAGTVDVSDGLHPFGVVGYVHGAAIDKPYIVERQYHNPSAPSEVLYSYAIEDELGAEVIPTDESGDPETQECLDTVDGDCHGIEWELWDPWPSLEKRPVGRVLTEGPSYWMGSLGEDGEDPTGLLYRRNRYYDPLAGQFTQEDPIGLAGGLNVYGFAGSDPVNFSDPFGLAPCELGERLDICLSQFEGAVVATTSGSECPWCVPLAIWGGVELALTVVDGLALAYDAYGYLNGNVSGGELAATAALFGAGVAMPAGGGAAGSALGRRLSGVLDNAALNLRPGRSAGVWQADGGRAEAQALFNQLTAGYNVVPHPGGHGFLAYVPGGGEIGLRFRATSTNAPVIDLNNIDGLVGLRKIHF